ncbi:hypothetical protein [Lactovum odontotermitis]
MPKDISADKRYQMGLTISRKENEQDQLSAEKRSFEQAQENFQRNYHQNFQQSSQFYEKMARSGNTRSEQELMTDYELERAVNRLSEQPYSEFEDYYRQKRNQLTDEIEQLHRERNALPWD